MESSVGGKREEENQNLMEFMSSFGGGEAGEKSEARRQLWRGRRGYGLELHHSVIKALLMECVFSRKD